MNNYTKMKALIAEFSGQNRVITVPRTYIEITGDYPTAVFLNQVVFYSDKSKRTDGYFYKSYSEWQDELLLSEKQIRRATKVLKDMGIIETMLKKANGKPTVHYKLDSDQLAEWILTKGQNGNLPKGRMDSDQKAESLTVDYTVDYTEEYRTDKRESASDGQPLKNKELNSFGQVIQTYQQHITFHIGEKTKDTVKHWLDESGNNLPLIVYAIERSKERVSLIDEKTQKPRPTNVLIKMREGLVNHLLSLWANEGIKDPEKAKKFEEANGQEHKGKTQAASGSRWDNA